MYVADVQRDKWKPTGSWLETGIFSLLQHFLAITNMARLKARLGISPCAFNGQSCTVTWPRAQRWEGEVGGEG